jgi:hypothetical protein
MCRCVKFSIQEADVIGIVVLDISIQVVSQRRVLTCDRARLHWVRALAFLDEPIF